MTLKSTKFTLLLICSGFQIKEALQLQLDAQRRLHEQLEVYPCHSFSIWTLLNSDTILNFYIEPKSSLKKQFVR